MNSMSLSTRGRVRGIVTMLLLILGEWSGAMAQGQRRVPAIFIFGDSLVEVGNNRSLAVADFYPYGIDSPQGSSGRLSNGKTYPDMIGQVLGLPDPLPYADPSTSGTRMLRGVNYASTAGGILDETGRHYGDKYSLSQQVLNFESNVNQMRSLLSGPDLSQLLSKSIVILNFGSNDYINNYLLPSLYPTSSTYKPPEYAKLLLNRYTRQILALHSFGLRKFFIAGVRPLGCTPHQRAFWQAPTNRCVDFVNQMLGTFNEGLRSLVDQLNRDHPGAIFSYGNFYGAMGDILNNPAKYGFTVLDQACCGIGKNKGQITCTPFLIPCSNRNQYVFWDAFHPTQSVDAVLAQRALYGPPSDVYPINIQQMALL